MSGGINFDTTSLGGGGNYAGYGGYGYGGSNILDIAALGLVFGDGFGRRHYDGYDFYLRFIRSKFGAEFRNSAYNQDFQTVANQAFAEFEKNYRKETPKNAQTGKKNSGANEADAGKNA